MIKQKTGWSDEEVIEHTPTIVVTYGEKGSAIMTAQGSTQIDICPVKEVVDPTGAGDAYRAGFIKGLLAGLPLESCARLASVAAAYVIESYGTQSHHFTMEDAKKRYKKTYGNALTLE